MRKEHVLSSIFPENDFFNSTMCFLWKYYVVLRITNCMGNSFPFVVVLNVCNISRDNL